jgi:PhzF family phenazine biosynthesis protein
VSVPLYQVDAFAAMPFAGNPAGVCLLPAAAESVWMAAVAKETNLPATAFVYPDGKRFSLRWFTATTELELCGHGTLASAHVLYEAGHVERRQPIHFQSRGGPLTATARDGWIELDFPAMPSAALRLRRVSPNRWGSSFVMSGAASSIVWLKLPTKRTCATCVRT